MEADYFLLQLLGANIELHSVHHLWHRCLEPLILRTWAPAQKNGDEVIGAGTNLESIEQRVPGVLVISESHHFGQQQVALCGGVECCCMH